MPARRDLILDQWTPLAHKTAIATSRTGRLAEQLAPTWVPPDEQRRINAYTLLAAYRLNAARYHTNTDQADQDERREYGDAALIISRVAAAVLGSTTTIAVPGAEPVAATPALPEQPDEPGDDATPLERRIAAIAQARWEAEAEAAVDAWEQAIATQPALAAREAWLRQWAETAQLDAKLVEGELDTVALADGVYRLNIVGGRVRVEVWDPGFYFPVLTDHDGDDYPSKVHLAYEFEGAEGRRFVRRLTYELVPLWALYDLDVETDDDGLVTLRDGHVQLDDGRLVRRHPWHPTDAEPEQLATHACLFSDGTWPLADISTHKVPDLRDDDAVWAVTDTGQVAHRLDLGIDFIPIIHTPNTPASRTHYGTSLISGAAQILDDLSMVDTDIQHAAALAAAPMVGVSGSQTVRELEVRPGAMIGLGEGGRLDVLDLTKSIPELRNVAATLLERLATNVQVPEEVQGRVAASEVPSGIALLLAFAPFEQLIGQLRLTRAPKHRLLLRFVQRLAQTTGELPEGETPEAVLRLGAFLPTDLAQIVDVVVKLLGQHGISRTTALRLLTERGNLPIGDLEAELAAIRADDTEGAVQVAEATASEQVAADRLGVVLPEPPVVEAPSFTIPGSGGDG